MARHLAGQIVAALSPRVPVGRSRSSHHRMQAHMSLVKPEERCDPIEVECSDLTQAEAEWMRRRHEQLRHRADLDQTEVPRELAVERCNRAHLRDEEDG